MFELVENMCMASLMNAGYVVWALLQLVALKHK